MQGVTVTFEKKKCSCGLDTIVTVYKETPKKVEMKVTPQSPSHLPLHLAQYLVFTLTQILYFLQEDHWIALPVLRSRGKWTELKKFFFARKMYFFSLESPK